MAQKSPSGWVGWVYFAGAMMLLAGGMQIIAGLTALFNDEYYVVTENALVALDYTTWGWVHLLLGILVFCAGSAIFAGRAWGRTVGVFLAVLAGLSQLAFISAYPFWSIIAVIVNVFVVYALTVHGDETELE